ncbi:transcriptional activator of fatty acid utilization [Aspergillus brasiliensis]|nr:transcriptional activator of fatty acid utilization [Aspergillus brasiliensis]
MLSLMDNTSSVDKESKKPQPVKLISGTNPLSALLGKDLKHTIVTNSCSFRTPDPVSWSAPTVFRKGSSLHSCDWESYYRSRGISAARLQFMSAVGCFNLPPAAQCSQLLEIYFKHIHPMLPVIERRDFLSSYYGSDNPPPLILLQAVFLAASRYMDEKGLNSALDSLSIAVRAGQEMGLHRKQHATAQSEASEQERLHRRIWWCTYTLDRLCAAQEGTPFIINERDCNVEPLTQDDLCGEDRVTSEVVLISLSQARVIEDTVRCLYQPPEDLVLPSPQGVSLRQKLLTQLDAINDRINLTLFSGLRTSDALQAGPKTLSVSFGTFLLSHLNAIRILIHRPFLLYCEPQGSGIQHSRNACRQHAEDILGDLKLLLEHDMLRYSWPFTVYAVVNCLLIFWYDVSSPPLNTPYELQKAHRNYMDVANLLRVMGETWWAAAAKHKLSLALAQAANVLLSQGRSRQLQPTRQVPVSVPVPSTTDNLMTTASPSNLVLSPRHGAPSETFDLFTNMLGITDWGPLTGEGDGLSEYNSMVGFWSSLGLDFDMDVAPNIFSIEPHEV